MKKYLKVKVLNLYGGASFAIENPFKCPVCMENYTTVDNQQQVIATTLKCGHSICMTCLGTIKGLRRDLRVCPLCRSEIDINDGTRPTILIQDGINYIKKLEDDNLKMSKQLPQENRFVLPDGTVSGKQKIDAPAKAIQAAAKLNSMIEPNDISNID